MSLSQVRLQPPQHWFAFADIATLQGVAQGESRSVAENGVVAALLFAFAFLVHSQRMAYCLSLSQLQASGESVARASSDLTLTRPARCEPRTLRCIQTWQWACYRGR